MADSFKKCYEHFQTGDCRTENCASKVAAYSNQTVSRETQAKVKGETRDYQYTSVPLKDAHGNVVAAFEMFVDETDAKNTIKLNDKLAAYRNAQTEKIVEALELLAKGDLSFDLKLDKPDEDTKVAYDLFEKIRKAIVNTSGSINHLVKDATMLADSAERGQLDIRADIKQHEGEFRNVISGINTTLDNVVRPINVAAEYVDRIAKGDIPPKITDKYQGDFNSLINNINTCIDAISRLVGDTKMLADSAAKGNLDLRADAGKHGGDFRTIVSGINTTLDNVIGPLNMAAEYVDRISKGDLPPKITDEYQGDFVQIKNNLNTCIDALTNLIGDMYSMAELHEQGDNEARINATNFFGAYRKMAEGVNSMIAEQLRITDKAMKCVEAFGDGDFNMELEKFSGKNISINNTIEQVRTNLNNLIGDTKLLSSAAIEGKLNVRADENKHKGGFRDIVKGINDTLDSFIKPVNITAAVIEKITTGVIPSKIDHGFTGDFVHVKDNLNNLIDTMNGILAETETMINAIIIGKLDLRGNPSKFAGVWMGLVENLNLIMEKVELPVKELKEILNRISVNDYTKKIQTEYSGVWNELKNATYDTMTRLENFQNLVLEISEGRLERMNELKQIGKRSENDRLVPAFIKMMSSIYELTEDMNFLTRAALEGALATRADINKHSGEYRTIVSGVNDILDAIISPISEAENILGIMATGKLGVRMQGDYKGDMQSLKQNINVLGDSLGSLIEKILEGVDTTSTAAVEISATAETIASSAQEQSSQTEEVAGAIEEMSRTVTENADNAVRTAEVARKNGEVAKEGGEIVSKTVIKMRDIAAVVKESADNIEKLGQSSKQIGEIISVIDDIADQTNLLALNAAIEAARAGEQGRGFAVVADEVRKLAERTTEATKKIANMIKGIQKDTDVAVKVMQNGNTEVTEGIQLADSAGESLKEIVVSSLEVLKMINQIATANEQQAATSEQIAQNIAVISNVSHESSQRIQEIAQSSEDLSRLTVELRDLVEHFDVGTNTKNAQVVDSQRTIVGQSKRYLES